MAKEILSCPASVELRLHARRRCRDVSCPVPVSGARSAARSRPGGGGRRCGHWRPERCHWRPGRCHPRPARGWLRRGAAAPPDIGRRRDRGRAVPCLRRPAARGRYELPGAARVSASAALCPLPLTASPPARPAVPFLAAPRGFSPLLRPRRCSGCVPRSQHGRGRAAWSGPAVTRRAGGGRGMFPALQPWNAGVSFTFPT